MNASDWVKALNLTPLEEGGHFREAYGSKVWSAYPQYDGTRQTATSVYYLLTAQEVQRFHRLRSDESWYFHAGAPLTIHVIAPDGEYGQHSLGLNIASGEQPQVVVPGGHIFGARGNPDSGHDYTLVSCTVSPGFDVRDVELFLADDLIRRYPKHLPIIRRLMTS